MGTKKILTVVGGISKDSLNQKLFKAVKELAPKDFELVSTDLSKLPFFSQDIENDPPEVVRNWKNQIKEANAVLFITPEYNRSIPGVLKNAIDWGSRPYGQNLWNGKPGGVMGASVGNIGTFGAQHHLRQVCAYLNIDVMGQPEFYFNGSKAFSDQGQLTDESTKKFISEYWAAYKGHLQKLGIE